VTTLVRTSTLAIFSHWDIGLQGRPRRAMATAVRSELLTNG